MLATTRPRTRRACLFALAGLAVLTASASANTYCVADAACVAAGGTDENGLVQQALDAAQLHAGLDRVQIGSGAFTGTGFHYLDPSASNGVQIVGAGRGLTTLSTTSANTTTILAVQGDVSTVQDLALALPGGTDDTGLGLTGASSAQRVDVRANSSLTNSYGFDLYNGGSLSDVTATLPHDLFNVAVNQRAGGAVVSNATLDSPLGIQASGSGVSTYRRISMKNTYTGVQLTCGAFVIEDTSIRLKAGNAAIQGGPGASPGCPGAAMSMTIRHVTITGDGASNTIGVNAVSVVSGGTNTVSVRDSTITNVTNALRRVATQGQATITTDYSNFDSSTDSDMNSGSGSGAITSTHHLNVTPGFVSAGDDHLAGGSALIDAGDPAGLAAGESALDLGGTPRILDGNGHPSCAAGQDIGAYEFVPGALGTVTESGPSQATVGSSATFNATGCSPNPAATLAFSWDFGDGGTGSGVSVSHAYSTAGARTVTLAVSDSDGRSSVRTLAVTVVAPAAPAAGGGSPDAGSPPGGSPASPQGGSPAGKRCVVPRLRGLTLASARRRLKAARCALGKVRSPRTRRRLVVRSSSPGAGAKLKLGARVALRMAAAPAASHHH